MYCSTATAAALRRFRGGTAPRQQPLLRESTLRGLLRPLPPLTTCPRVAVNRRVSLAAAGSNCGGVQLSDLLGAKGKVTRSAVVQLKVQQLKELCVSFGLDDQGKKTELVDRVFGHICGDNGSASDALSQQHIASTPTAPSPPDTSSSSSGRAGEGKVEVEGGVRTGQVTAGAPRPSIDARKAELDSWLATEAHEGGGGPSIDGCDSDGTRDALPGREDEVLEFGTAAQRARRKSPQRPSTGCAVTWLGTSSGSPTHDRNVSCIAVELDDSSVALVDCGEGTKRQIARSHLDISKVRHVFITHHHGDHIFGLPGLIAAISIASAEESKLGGETGREAEMTAAEAPPLFIYGPPGIMEYVYTSLKLLGVSLNMRVLVTEWHKARAQDQPPQRAEDIPNLWYARSVPTRDSTARASQVISANTQARRVGVVTGLLWSTTLSGGFRVAVGQLFHRVPTFGYCFMEPRRAVEITPEVAARHSIDGDPAELEASRPGRKLLILGDTCDSTSVAHVARGVDMLSHEATFSDGMEKKAAVACHSTSRMAGEFAASIHAERLFLTHFSPRYQEVNDAPEGLPGEDITTDDLQTILRQAEEGFRRSEVYAVKDFATYHVPLREPQFRRREVAAARSSGAGTAGRRQQEAVS
eukprot:CAMPEP_0177773866 /NCGR_PEP_ID=MMETSP0491_2-20121128/13150_1 /TAXON_ID=63592 /ORGANISM="Tetraselmis chuii, Strain PLY429" /LENGTH=641 /DNA_ID=CAMNT_0019292103 /DNA_START=46 /DNA_END=1971 /DNA_ORIENTATION=-